MEDPVQYESIWPGLYLYLPYLQDLMLYLSSKPPRFGATWPVSFDRVGWLMEAPPYSFPSSPGDVIPLVPDFIKSWWGLFTDSIANLLRFSMPTHTHDVGNDNDGYGHLKIAFVRSLADCQKTVSLTVWNLDTVSKSKRIMIFKIANLLIRLGNLMICIHNLIVLTKTKECNWLLWIAHIRWRKLSRQSFLSF
jgi:hypothetical protein